MANRLNAPNQFESLAPPWLLTQLDTNFTQNQASWNDSSLGFVNGVPTDTGTANNYTITAANLPFGSPTGYNKGMTLFWIPANTNTGASSITVLPLGSTGIVTRSGLALSGGEIAANKMLGMVHDGTNFRIITPCGIQKQFGNVGTSQSLDCAGYDSVFVDIGFTVTGLGITLQHIGIGVSITIALVNSVGSSANFGVGITDPSGTAFTSILVVPSGGVGGRTSIIFGSGSIAIGANQSRIMTGVSGTLTMEFT